MANPHLSSLVFPTSTLLTISTFKIVKIQQEEKFIDPHAPRLNMAWISIWDTVSNSTSSITKGMVNHKQLKTSI